MTHRKWIIGSLLIGYLIFIAREWHLYTHRHHYTSHPASLSASLPRGVFLAQEGLTQTIGSDHSIRYRLVNKSPSPVKLEVVFVYKGSLPHSHRFEDVIFAKSRIRRAHQVEASCIGNGTEVLSVRIAPNHVVPIVSKVSVKP